MMNNNFWKMECETQKQKLLRDGKQEIGHDSGRD
jgi:hypothetical protein